MHYVCLSQWKARNAAVDFDANVRAHMIFRLGEQKLNDFSVGGEKNGEIQSRQSNSKYNFMQYVFLEKKVYTLYNGVWGKAGEFSSISVLKVTLQSVR